MQFLPCFTNSSTEKLSDAVDSAEKDKLNSRYTKTDRSKVAAKDAVKEGTIKSQAGIGGAPIKIFDKIASGVTDQQAYCAVASRVKSIIGFVKVAYPDLVGGDGFGKDEPLNNKDRKVCRSKLLTCVERGLHGGPFTQNVVYDLDALASNSGLGDQASTDRALSNWDESRVGKRSIDVKHLLFESRFESGNLRKAMQVQLCGSS